MGEVPQQPPPASVEGPQRPRMWAPERTFLRFVLAGVMNAAFGLGVYSLCIAVGLPVLIALVAANVLGVGFNYLTLGGYAFRQLSWQVLPRFVLAYCVIVGLNWVLVRALMVAIDAGPVTAQILLTVPMALASFVILTRCVFRSV